MEMLGSCGGDLGCDLRPCHALIEETSRKVLLHGEKETKENGKDSTQTKAGQ
jgi:hypothetical protein